MKSEVCALQDGVLPSGWVATSGCGQVQQRLSEVCVCVRACMLFSGVGAPAVSHDPGPLVLPISLIGGCNEAIRSW